MQKKTGAIVAEASKEAEAAAKKAASEYAASVKAAQDFIAALQLEGAQLGKNAEQLKEMAAQRAAAKAPTKALSEQILAEAEALAVSAQMWGLRDKAEASALAVSTEYFEKLAGGVKAIDDQITAMKEQIEVYGKTETAVVDLARAKAEAALAAGPASYAELIALDAQIAKLKELRALTGDKAGLDATKDIANEQKTMWDLIDKTAHDTFVSIADGGKGAAQRLKDTFKNVFFDWLYQQTIKKWIVNVQASTSGASGGGLESLFSDSGSTGAGGGSDWLSVGQKIYSGFSKGASAGGTATSGGSAGGSSAMGGASSTAAAWLVAAKIGQAIGNKISDGYSVNGQGGSKGFINFSTLTNSVPILGGLVGGLINRGFGRRDKEYSDSMVTGTLGAGGVAGGAVSSDWTQKGGWFKSDRKGTDTQALNAEMAAALAEGYQAVKDATVNYAAAFGLSADVVAGYTKTLNMVLTKDEAKNKQMLADLFGSIGEELATRVVPNIAAFKMEGEATSATLQRLAVNFQVIDGMLLALSTTSQQAFGAVGVASIEARERLIALAGGVDALASQMTFFADNFLTDAQKIAPVQKMVTDQLAALGYSGVTTADQFRDAVLNLATTGKLATEQGAGLLALAPAFKQVADAAKAAADTAATAAKEAADAAAAIAQEAADKAIALAASRRDLEIQIMELTGNAVEALSARRDIELAAVDESLRPLMSRIYALQDEKDATTAAAAAAQSLVATLRSTASAAFDALGKSIAAKKGALQQSFDALMESFDKRIGISNGRVASLQGLQTALKGARTGAADTTGMARQMAQAQIGAVLAIARASGVLPEASALEDALRAVGGDATDQFSSMADFLRDQLRTANQIEELAALTDGQLTVEQRTLQALIDQKTQAQAAYAADVAGLDAMLAAAQLQLNAVNGVNTSVLSVVTALAQFTASLGAAMGNTTVSQQSGMSQAAQIESMYQTMLGRKSDAGGMQFYLDALKTGSTMADIAGYFAKSPEYQSLYTAQPPRTPTTEGSAMLTELQTMNQRLANVESATRTTSANTGKTADQIDSISAGGGALRVEMA